MAQANGVMHGGLANQMLAFLGLLIFADQKNASLVLPRWRTYDKVKVMDMHAVWGNITWPQDFPPVIGPPLPADVNLSNAIVVDGWRVPRQDHPFTVPLHTQIFVPRPELLAHIDNFIAQYGTSYGALHARVERDMRGHRRFGATVINVSQILEIMDNSTLPKVDTLFVAVGDNLLPDDRETLERGVTPWGGRLVRRRDFDATIRATYLERSIIDMAICTQAQYFVGFPRSTFSIMVHFKRRHLGRPAPSFYYDNATSLFEESKWANF